MEVLERRFAAIGARIKISGRQWRGVPEINVGVDPRGHDERHWFVAAVPESERGVSGVAQAMVALQPMSVREAEALKKPKHPLDRKNTAYMRQGEWFFVPTPVSTSTRLRCSRRADHARSRQPAHRRAAHRVREAVRGPRAHQRAVAPDGSRRRRLRTGNGASPDHATIVLHTWHRVEMNTEQRARAMRHVAFLD